MSTALTQILKIARLLPRAAVITVLLAAPVLAVPSLRSDAGHTIVAPDNKNSGAGLVLIVSLRRAS